MTRFSRRALLKVGGAGLAASAFGSCALGDEKTDSGPPEPLPCPPVDFRYPELGRVRPVASKDIEASPLGVGFECLDRMMYDPKRAYRHVGRLGVKWARCQTGWARTERKPGEYDFAWLDDVVDSLLAEGVMPWLSISYGNKLYSPDAPDGPIPGFSPAVGWAPILSERAKTAWIRYVKTLVRRYSDRVTHWEIWNESNAGAFWKPLKSSPEAYTELVKLTSAEIRKNAPDAVVIGGAFAHMPFKFLEGCLELGMGDCVDIVSFHPYGVMPEMRRWGKTYPEAFAEWKELIARYNPKIKHWQGECGLPSRGGKGVGTLRDFPWSETYQAKWLPRRILMDRLLELDMTSYFTAVDLDYGMGVEQDKINYKGLIRRADYTPKQAYFVYQCLCALFDAQTNLDDAEPEVLQTSLDPGRVCQIQTARFARHGKAIFAVWFPSKLPTVFPRESISLKLPIAGGANIADPVLVDPMSQKVFRLDGAAVGPESVTVSGLPLADYPLLITDRSVALATGEVVSLGDAV